MDVKRNIVIKLTFEDEKQPYFLDLTNLFYDFELLHDFSLILYAEEYHNHRFSQFFWYRNGRRVKDEHKLRVVRIIKESPLVIELVLSSVAVTSGAIWVIVQAFEKIGNLKLNEEKLKLEIEKLKKENKLLTYNKELVKIELEKKLQEKEDEKIYNILLKRLESNPLKLKNLDITSDRDTTERDD